MKSFKQKIYFHREKEDNWNIQDKAEELGFKETTVKELSYLGMEVEMEVEISEDGLNKVLRIGNSDVSEKEIYV